MHFSILVNGSTHGLFGSSRRIRQGDPLSSLFFVIVMEALSKMMEKTVGESLLVGFSMGREGRNNLLISHLLFADDTLIFCENDPGWIWHLWFLYTWFEVISRLKVKLGKYELVPVGAVSNLEALANILGVWNSKFSNEILGITIGC